MAHSKNLKKNTALSPYDSLSGKRVLITGASSGIGATMAKLFALHGAKIGIHYRNSKNSALNVLREIKSAGGEGELFKGDLLQRNVRANLISKFINKFGGIDILINNAGAILEYKHFSRLTETNWDDMFALHAKASFVLSQKAFANMTRQKWGRIINISTNATKYASPNIMHYYSSKASLEAVTLGFAKEGTKHNILVNAIRCGNINTPMHTKFVGYSEKKNRERIRMIPLARAGNPEEIAHLALFLCSSASDFTTGQIITVAGGE
ncbi:MAG: hypothetical protein UX94_C0004G0010 [Parcubacteria group bacterium GW2011_GWA2_47_21]|nr:MAG: hypothetical protein UX94_C0004G0010 [Parcubacteria group bacterium GW2011_GWA2_47_21]